MIPLMKVTGEVSSVVLHRCSCYHLTQLIGVLEKMKRIQENMHLSLSCLKIALTFFYSYNVIVKPKSVNSKQSLVMLLLFRPRMLLAFILIPLLQKQLDIFKDTIWNTHRIRAQKDTVLPDGIPNHIYSFPEEYDMEECGM